MIDMCMSQKDCLYIRSGYRNLYILKNIYALLHTAVYKVPLGIDLQHGAASCYFMCRAYKS